MEGGGWVVEGRLYLPLKNRGSSDISPISDRNRHNTQDKQSWSWVVRSLAPLIFLLMLFTDFTAPVIHLHGLTESTSVKADLSIYSQVFGVSEKSWSVALLYVKL